MFTLPQHTYYIPTNTPISNQHLISIPPTVITTFPSTNIPLQTEHYTHSYQTSTTERTFTSTHTKIQTQTEQTLISSLSAVITLRTLTSTNIPLQVEHLHSILLHFNHGENSHTTLTRHSTTDRIFTRTHTKIQPQTEHLHPPTLPSHVNAHHR